MDFLARSISSIRVVDDEAGTLEDARPGDKLGEQVRGEGAAGVERHRGGPWRGTLRVWGPVTFAKHTSRGDARARVRPLASAGGLG
jgi:hypothetical protein